MLIDMYEIAKGSKNLENDIAGYKSKIKKNKLYYVAMMISDGGVIREDVYYEVKKLFRETDIKKSLLNMVYSREISDQVCCMYSQMSDRCIVRSWSINHDSKEYFEERKMADYYQLKSLSSKVKLDRLSKKLKDNYERLDDELMKKYKYEHFCDE